MSGAPLSGGSWEILRALVLAIQIRESAEGWRPSGLGQIRSAGVDASHISELLASGFIAFDLRGSERFARVSESGLRALEEKAAAEMRELCKCLSSVKLEPQIY